MFEKQCNFSAMDLEPAFWKTTAFGPISSPLHLCPCDVLQECLSPVVLPPTKLFFTLKASQESALTPLPSRTHPSLSLT